MDIDEIMKALANPVRRDILAWLKDPAQHFQPQSHPLEDGVCVGRIFERAGLSQSTVSAYLAMLQRAGLVTSKRIGQWVFYQRNEKTIREFLKQMKQDL
jgi:ArsR family transcriptional regulator